MSVASGEGAGAADACLPPPAELLVTASADNAAGPAPAPAPASAPLDGAEVLAGALVDGAMDMATLETVGAVELDTPRPVAELVTVTDGPAAAPSVRRPWWKRVDPVLTLIIVLGVGLPLLVAGMSGNLSIPHNDAWSYSRIAQTFGRTGHIVLLGWNRSALIGQIVVLGPLASSLIVQQCYVAVLGAVCLVCVYDLTLPLLGRRRALLACALVPLWPGFALMSTSFMPDVPAFTAALGTLALGRRALERDSRLYLALALALALWGATIRAQDLAAPASLLFYALYTRRERRSLHAAAVCVGGSLFSLGFLAFSLWHATLAHGDPPTYDTARSVLDTGLNLTVKSYFALALPVAPAVLLVSRPWLWGRRAQVTSAATFLLALAAIHDFRLSQFFPGDYLEPSGAYSAVTQSGRTVIPLHYWWPVVLLASVSGALLAGLIVSRWRGMDPLLGLFALTTALGTLATAVAGQGVFDRYVMPMAPAVLVLVLSRVPQRAPRAPRGALLERLVPRRSNALAATAAAGLVVVLAAALTANAYSFDSARWRVATELARAGDAPAARIDAGLEWLGYHSPAGVVDRYPKPRRSYGWEGYFSSKPSCLVVQPLVHHGPWTLEEIVDYRSFLVVGAAKLYVYATHAVGCG